VGSAAFATTVSEQEAACGFGLVHHVSGKDIVRRHLENGLYAVKVEGNGGCEYVICDENLIPLYTPAKSLPELKQRFGSG
jgi:glutamate synthase domain-containing protein 1